MTIDSIYSSIPAMNIALTKHFEDLIARLVASGRYNNSSEVVRAGLSNPVYIILALIALALIIAVLVSQ